MDEAAMEAYFHLLKSVETISSVDDETKMRTAYTLFKVVTQKRLTLNEKRTVEDWWKNWRIYSRHEVQ